MSRQLLCPACAQEFNLHPEDKANGIKIRKVEIQSARRPPNLQIRIKAGNETTIIPVPVIVCDHCNDEIPEGSKAVGVTMWGKDQEEPEPWEKEYGHETKTTPDDQYRE